MKIIFFGTGKFGLPSLKKLHKSSHEIVAVVTQPDKKKGRGWSVRPTPIKAFVEQAAPGMDVFQPEKASDAQFIDSLRKMDADIFVVIDYGQLLDKDLLDVPRKCCVNLHPSLLPKYRGAAPVNRAILNGEEETGNTVIRMTERMDAGSVIMQEKTEIGEDEDAEDLLERLSYSGADLLLKALSAIESGEECLSEQDESAAAYAPKLGKKEGEIDWTVSAQEVVRKVRAMQPWPGAFTHLDSRTLKVIHAAEDDASESSSSPGTISDETKFIVNTGKGSVRVTMLQLEGKKAMTSAEFLRGHPAKKGTVLK
ncbi:MAG: methionyl-tRNA formyltransferase [Candidatus Omnitrophota bacterium]